MEKIKEFLCSNRVKSFLWRLGAFVAVGLIDMLIKSLGGLGLDPQVLILVSLLLGETTKALNNFLAGKEA